MSASEFECDGYYQYPGQAAREAARITFRDASLTLRLDASERLFTLSQLEIRPAPEGVPQAITFPDGGRFMPANPAAFRHWYENRHRKPPLINALERRKSGIAAALIGTLLTAVFYVAVLLPWLAWEYAITWWDERWTEAQKRSVIKSAAGVNKRRGTAGAVKRALAAVDYPCDVIEWFNDTPKAAPYTFRVEIHGNSISEETLARLASQVNDAKNARSLLSDITIAEQIITGSAWAGGAVFSNQSVTLKAKKRDE